MTAGQNSPLAAVIDTAEGPFADANPAHIALFARASARLSEEIARANRSAWTRRMAQSAQDWCAHREPGRMGNSLGCPSKAEPPGGERGGHGPFEMTGLRV